MADINVEIVTDIEGLDELEEAFTGGSKRAIVKFLRKVEMKAAKPLVRSLEETAPYNTGNLEGSIGRQSVVGDGTVTVRVGPSSSGFYGIFQEFGTVHDPALHWMENGARAVQDEVLQEFVDAANEGLEDMKK